MVKAKLVRSKRLEKLEAAMLKDAEKVFEWILDLMEEDTQNNRLGPLNIYIQDNQFEIHATNSDVKLNMSETFHRFEQKTFFILLKKLIEQEDGFKVELNLNGILYNSQVIIMKISIE